MKQTLQIRIGQHLAMTPQLQQAIRLLQLSALDLREEIQEALDSNPMLELSDGEEGGGESSGEARDSDAVAQQDSAAVEFGEAPMYGDSHADSALNNHLADDHSDSSAGSFDESPEMSAGLQSDITDGPELRTLSDDLPVDSVWEDIYDSALSHHSQGGDAEGREFESQDCASETLRDHLTWQMHMTNFSARDVEIAHAIIDSINDRGYLAVQLEDIREGLARELLDLDLQEVEAVLRQIQNFDPIGVGARDLRECILIQLQLLPPDTPWLEKAKELVGEHLQLLADREYNQLMRRLKCSQPELQEVLMLIQSVNPHPGHQIADGRAEYVVPDVIVTKDKNTWRVELNPDAVPRVRINAGYAGLVRRADSSSDNAYMRNQLQEARWFVKSLQSRNETLLKVASCIVERQRGFLEHGEEAMKALVLHDVATVVEMHESTISRVTTQKYMHTPRGIFELKYFFSSHVSTDEGGECSATAIRALIKKLVAAEDHGKPLSDSKIAQILNKEQGINVARRTIAKYREALSIPASSERKRLV
ncbi:MAG: RNA polymerase factor sigma-54 [Chromatiales bacterium]|jgi:RNA polymerase sigma-54 factor|nr:RNA polymerase factor sigma-54 [Chromatiales bacterium]